MKQHQIAIVGGNNVDIIATSDIALIYGDSNPGKVVLGMGGVGRNIGENLIRLGQKVRMVTAFGDDAFASLAAGHAQGLGMDLSDSLHVPGEASSLYICVSGPDGDLSVAVSDMSVCDYLTPQALESRMEKLNQAEAIVAEANLSEETLCYLARHCTTKLYVDAVSAKKAVRLQKALGGITGIKGNRRELEAIIGQRIVGDEGIQSAANALHESGVKLVMLTLGDKGAFVSDGSHQAMLPTMVTHPVNTSGCGDAFFAGAVCARLDGGNVRDTLRAGLAAAAVCAGSPMAVSPSMSQEALLQYLSREEKQ